MKKSMHVYEEKLKIFDDIRKYVKACFTELYRLKFSSQILMIKRCSKYRYVR